MVASRPEWANQIEAGVVRISDPLPAALAPEAKCRAAAWSHGSPECSTAEVWMPTSLGSAEAQRPNRSNMSPSSSPPLSSSDPAAGEGCAIFHELVRAALDGDDPLSAVDDALAAVLEPYRDKWATVLAPTWTPNQATEANSAVWPTLGSAVWALRVSSTFEEAMRRVVDLGGDTDTVAAVTGGLCGAVFGIVGIPMRWTSAVHGTLPGFDVPVTHLGDLHELAARLDGEPVAAYERPRTVGLGPTEIADELWAADLSGAADSDQDFAVVSLCRTGGRFGHEIQRWAYVVDDESNTELGLVVDDVVDDIVALQADSRRVLVHCYGGASRTGLILRAWLMRQRGMSFDGATAYVADRWMHLGLWNDSFTQHLSSEPEPDGPRTGGASPIG